jgi:hypothetical protein
LSICASPFLTVKVPVSFSVISLAPYFRLQGDFTTMEEGQ